MATQFTEIYKMNELLRNDNRLKAKPTNMIYELYYDYLKYGIGLFFRHCYQDIKNHTPFTQTEYWFKSDGIDNEFLLQYPSIPLDNSKFYVGYAKDENTTFTAIPSYNYTYDSDLNILTISTFDVPEGYIIYISSYIIGEFQVDLEFDEIDILVQGMNIPFQEEQQNRNSLLNQTVYGASQNMYSQAQHISAIHNVVKDQEDKVLNMITKYSYTANPTNLSGLGGRA